MAAGKFLAERMTGARTRVSGLVCRPVAPGNAEAAVGRSIADDGRAVVRDEEGRACHGLDED